MTIYAFENFELDTDLYELRRDGSPCRVEPQVFDVLRLLLERRDRVVSKDDLFNEIWKGKVVTDSALTSRLKAARAVLGDGGREQRLIKTVHGRGFRFTGQVAIRGDTESPPSTADSTSEPPARGEPAAPSPPGRSRELSTLLDCLSKARTGERQFVFVNGEAGFGKTTLLRSFIGSLAGDDSMYVAHGQCLQSHGSGEAYMPVLEAVSRLSREDDSGGVSEILLRFAPTWVEQMPGMGNGPAVDTDPGPRGNTQDRMLREMIEALEALAHEQTLLLLLEDIHWSDPSTIDLIARLAMRPDTARLLVVASVRYADLESRAQPLYSAVDTLVVRGHAVDLKLDVLDEISIRHYLTRRLGTEDLPAGIVDALLQRTGGHPFFMHIVVEQWLADGLISKGRDRTGLTFNREEATKRVPHNLKSFIQNFIDELDAGARRVLETAAVRGTEFTTAETAASLDMAERDVESHCSALARHGRWLRATGIEEWPDGTASAKFAFVHDLYQQVWYELVPVSERTRLHRRIAGGLESAYGDRSVEHATELASHFLQGRVADKAIGYLRQSASLALGRVAPREAIEAIEKALSLLPRLDDDEERARQELALQVLLAPPLIALEGVGSERAEAAFERARALCEQLGERVTLHQVLYGMGAMYEVRGEFNRAQDLMQERFGLIARGKDDVVKVETYELLACSLFHQGKFNDSLKHARDGMERFELSRHSVTAPSYGENPGISCRFWAALDYWFMGDPARALELMEEGIEMSLRPDQEYCVATAYIQAATLSQLMRDVGATLKWASMSEGSGAEQGYRLRAAMGLLMQGWARAMTGSAAEGVDMLERGIEIARGTGACMDRPYFLGLLAEALGEATRYEAALATVDEALADTEDRTHFFYAAELHRMRGKLLLASGSADDEAESSLRQAVTVATEQGARSMLLRASTTLGGHLRDRGDGKSAARILHHALDGFDASKDTPDLIDARALMASL